MQRSAERDVERNASPHLFTPHSDLPASFASDAPPTGRQWLDTAIRFDQSEQSSRHCSFIPFNYAVQKLRRLVRERSEELSKNASIASRGRDWSANFSRCIRGTFDCGAT